MCVCVCVNEDRESSTRFTYSGVLRRGLGRDCIFFLNFSPARYPNVYAAVILSTLPFEALLMASILLKSVVMTIFKGNMDFEQEVCVTREKYR